MNTLLLVNKIFARPPIDRSWFVRGVYFATKADLKARHYMHEFSRYYRCSLSFGPQTDYRCICCMYINFLSLASMISFQNVGAGSLEFLPLKYFTELNHWSRFPTKDVRYLSCFGRKRGSPINERPEFFAGCSVAVDQVGSPWLCCQGAWGGIRFFVPIHGHRRVSSGDRSLRLDAQPVFRLWQGLVRQWSETVSCQRSMGKPGHRLGSSLGWNPFGNAQVLCCFWVSWLLLIICIYPFPWTPTYPFIVHPMKVYMVFYCCMFVSLIFLSSPPCQPAPTFQHCDAIMGLGGRATKVLSAEET